MKRIAVVLAAVMTLTFGASAPAASLLSNSGFEWDTAGQNQSLFGWQRYGPNVYNETDGSIAHSGTNFFKVYQAFNGAVNSSGIYEDYISGPGASYTADGWAYTATNDAIAGQNVAWLEVTFRDALGNMLALYRSAIISTNLTGPGGFSKGLWHDLAVTNQYDVGSYQRTNTVARLIAPPGTAYLRYQIVFQGDANYSAGSVYFDDLNLVQTGGAPYGNMNIVWTDEFDGAAIKPNIWTFDLGGGGWGNNEFEYYTSRTNNAFVTNGLLHIVALNESYNGASYTSARIKSQGLFSCRYGRIEWRAKLPAGVGCWPALWMLGTNINPVGWPGCGEIDVMENTGSNLAMAQGSIHSGTDATATYNFTDGLSSTNFHTYTLDWTTNAILFYVDGHLYETQTSWGSSTANGYPFPFNQPFFLIMNLAIGGDYVGNPSQTNINAGTVFPAEVLVDYVRIYSSTAPLSLDLKKSGSKYLLTWPSNIVCRLQAETNSSLTATGWSLVATNTNQFQVVAGGSSAFYRLVTP